MSDKVPPPRLDYTARDYAGLRRLMLDRLAQLLPEWQGERPADPLTTVVEVLAAMGDYLSYYQDAVATEAYLETARRRLSVRRHARLLDYVLHDGTNARTWVTIKVNEDICLPQGTVVPTAQPGQPHGLPMDYAGFPPDTVFFATMEAVSLRKELNDIALPDLPDGAVQATLAGPLPESLNQGRIVILGDERYAQAVRIGTVSSDRKTITWHIEDYLRAKMTQRVHLYGNVVLADYGRWLPEEELKSWADWESDKVRAKRDFFALTHAVPLPRDPMRSAFSLLAVDPREAVAQVRLVDTEGHGWHSRRDLLDCYGHTRAFVVEPGDEDLFSLRFGDGTFGSRRPEQGPFHLWVRQGNGPSGNIAARQLRHVVCAKPDAIVAVENLVTAVGGTRAEPIADAKRLAPLAFRENLRAVTGEDRIFLLKRHPFYGKLFSIVGTGDAEALPDIDKSCFRKMIIAYVESYRLAGTLFFPPGIPRVD